MRTQSVSRPFLSLIGGAFVVVLGVTLGLVGWPVRHHAEATRLTEQLDETVALNRALRSLFNRQLQLAESGLRSGQAGDPEALQRLHFETGRRTNDYLRIASGLEERRAVESLRTLQSELALHVQYIQHMLEAGRPEQALARLNDLMQVDAMIDVQLEALSAITSRRLHDLLGDRSGAFAAFVTVASAALVLLGTCLGFVVLLRRRVLGPLRDVTNFADRVAEGDDPRPLIARGNDEIAHLTRRINRMAERLSETHNELEAAVEARTAELQRVHAQLVQSEKMSAVGRLVSGVAHELNNPLTTIMGYTELARSDVGENPSVHEMLDVVVDQTERAKRIIQELLQLARQRPTARSTIRLEDAVSSALDLYRHSARTAEIGLHYTPPREPCFIQGDRYKLQQVVLALLSNAADATAEVDRPGAIDVTVVEGDGWAGIDIRDNGPGIAQLEHIFEPFYTTKADGLGTGLGLSVSYGIVEEHGGTIEAHSPDRGGALFRVRLPRGAAPTTRASDPERTPGEAQETGARVLLVDDEPQVLAIQCRYVQRLGMHCVAASSGQEAIERLRAETFDIVVTDLRMPGSVNGLTLYEWIRDHRPGLERRTLFVSGDLVGVGAEPATLPGPYLLKPFSFEEFGEAVRALVPVGALR